MFLSTLKKNNTYLFCLLVCMTSCSSKYGLPDDTIEIPCYWHTPLAPGINLEDPACFLWWDALEDPLLTALIEQAIDGNKDVRLAKLTESKEKVLETINAVAAEVAKNYITLRGLQNRLQVLNENTKAQNQIILLNEGLSSSSLIERHDNQKNHDLILLQKSDIDLSINKIIYHLSTLIGEPPGSLYDTLEPAKQLPKVPCDFPVGVPEDLIRNNPTIQAAKKDYISSRNKQAFYNYQKVILSELEGAETAIATYLFAVDKNSYVNDIQHLKAESYTLTKDLYDRGLKDDRELLRAHQDLLIEEDALIQSKVDLLNNYVGIYQALGNGC